MNTAQSQAAFKAACQVMPGGVSSPVRAFRGVGGTPRVIARAKEAVITDVDGNRYIDYVGSWGPLILGHADDRVVAAIGKAAGKGCSFGAPTEAETQLAELIVARVPSIEMVRFVNSGTEATMSAIRLARGYTGRDKIIKFEGCYHGHCDALLVQAGSGAMTFGAPSSPGVPAGTTADTLVLAYNDLEVVADALGRHGEQVAAVLLEPIAGNMGCIPPREGYLEGLRRLCDEHQVVLIFDEVMTGFRVSAGGAQQLYGVQPDLTCLGKIVGGGLPMAVYGGRREIMEKVSPVGEVYQAGTLSGNPLAMAAGIATLQALADDDAYETLEASSARLADGLKSAARSAGVSTYHTRVGSMMCTFFSSTPVIDYTSAGRCDTASYATFFHAMLDRGVYLAPSQFECLFVSLAHTGEQIEQTITASAEAFEAVAAGR
ncbi:MAG: glutamate-1-semialdehyde 2,1-aminomutase [Phycisphaerae bacterium]|nr:glutamate-1-semialdehyde 2,1-aminomutase [Phycisphaerae bacterium]